MLPTSVPIVDHRALQQVANSLRQMAIETPDELPRHRVQQALEDFRALLQAHFTYEEQAGYIPHITAERPTLLPWAERLVSEHEGLLADVDQLLRTAAVDDVADLCQRVTAVLDRLSIHERAELNLATEALLPDGLW